MSTDIVSVYRDGISEEITRARCASGYSGTGIDPRIDRWGAGLKSPLGCRLADAMVAQAIYQWILVINAMWLWRRVSGEAPERVVPEVVVTCPGEE